MRLRGFTWGAGAVALAFTVGCGGSDDPPAEGGLYFSIGVASNPPTGKGCTIGSHQASIGKVAPSQTDKGRPVVDGESGARVACSTSGGGTISFRGNMSASNVAFAIANGSVEKGGTGTALVQEYDPAGGAQLESPDDQPCTVSVVGEKLVAKDGIVWATVDCPVLISTNQPSVYCAGNGVFVMQNCD